MTQNQGEWPTAGANNRRTGFTETIIKPPLKKLWSCEEAVNPKGGIVVSDGIAVCGEWARSGMNSYLHAVDIKDGSRLWSYPLKGIVMGWPLISNGLVFTGQSSKAICLDLKTGREVWTVEGETVYPESLPIATVGCPLCLDHVVVYRDDQIKLMETSSGRTFYNMPGSDDPRENAGPCSDVRNLYLPKHREIIRLNFDTLKVEASAHTNGKVNAGPILADDLLVYCSNRSVIEALDALTLEMVWSFAPEDPELHSVGMDSACAYAHGMLYVGGLDGNLYALDVKTGSRVWKYRVGKAVSTTPIVCGDVVYLNASDKGLCGLNAFSGEVLCEMQFWQGEYQMGTSGLAVSGSILLAGSDKLYAFVSDQS